MESKSTQKSLPRFVIAEKKARQHRMMLVRERLVERFPKCFKPFGQPKLPLMVGIDRAVKQEAPSIGEWHDVINAITDYCTGKSYLAALIEGTPRVDLNGDAAGRVTSGNQQHAQMRLKKLMAKETEKEKQSTSISKSPPKAATLSVKAVKPKAGAKVVVEVVKRRQRRVGIL